MSRKPLKQGICGQCGIPVYKESKLCKPCNNKRPRSPEANQSIRESKLGEKNPAWRGDSVGYASLHEWVKRRIEKPDKCICCNDKQPVDIANISGLYKRDLLDWEYLCRSCHMKKDGRINNLKIGNLRRTDLCY